MDRGEEKEQAAFVKWCSLPPVRAIAPAAAWIYHCPNGGKRDAMVGAQMVALGVKRGVPDILLPYATPRHNGLAIEFKSKTGTTTPQQDAWLAHLSEQGWRCDIARSAYEAIKILAGYLGNPALLSLHPPL